MKEIIYKGKKVKVPFEDANYTLDGDKDIEIQNPFSGEKATVPGSWFRDLRNNSKGYMNIKEKSCKPQAPSFKLDSESRIM